MEQFSLLPGLLGIFIMVLFSLLGVPIFISMGLVGIIGIALTTNVNVAIGVASTLPFAILASYTLAVVPLFYLMGEIAHEADITKDAYNAGNKLVGTLRGGLAMATTVGSGFSAACMGSSVANAALFTKIAFPEMTRFNYDKSFALGCIASAGTFAIMIPPSIALVVYGIITEESVGKLLMAGLLPGILTIFIYLFGIWVLCKLNPKLAPVTPIKYTFKEKISGTLGLWSIIVLFILVLGGIYLGIFTPSAGGAVGALGAFIIAFFRKKLNKATLNRIALDTVKGVSAITVIIVGGFLLARFLVMSGFVEALVSIITSQSALTPMAIMVLIAIMYLLLGCVMDGVSMMVVTMPFIYPIVISLGFDGIWFGIVFIKLTEIGLLTPPIGANLYIVASSAGKDVKVEDVIKGVIPFLIMEVVVLTLLILFPRISLFLPSLMYSG